VKNQILDVMTMYFPWASNLYDFDHSDSI